MNSNILINNVWQIVKHQLNKAVENFKKEFVLKSSFGVIILFLMFSAVLGQTASYTNNAKDQSLRGSGRVNASTLGMEFGLPLGSYPGRGINIPITLNYSSKLWQIEYNNMSPRNNMSPCRSNSSPVYSRNSASGWTSSLATPYIEYTGSRNAYNQDGTPLDSESSLACDPRVPTETLPRFFTRRLTLYLPGGGAHELRLHDSLTGEGNTWDGIYYAVDSSNIKYVQDPTNGIYRALMPDGSFYDFDTAVGTANRLAKKFSDRNGNFTSYHAATTNYPNGYWTDTLGKIISIPLGLKTPNEPTSVGNPQIYTMQGMSGNYKFHWKRLKGGSAAERGLSDFNQSLRYEGDCKVGSGNTWTCRPPENSLFISLRPVERVTGYDNIFNPIVLTEIELPTGESYKFGYNVYGEIDSIAYPTGGKEKFIYGQVNGATYMPFPYLQGSRGVRNQKVYEAANGSSYYEWNYQSDGFVGITNPDGTKIERYLYQGNSDSNFGFEDALAGMPYKELAFSSTGAIVSQKLTSWTKSTGERHPRMSEEENIVYDASGNGVSTTTKYEYEGNLSLKETPVLLKKTTQFAFRTVTSGENLSPTDQPCNPGDECGPFPSPTPTPTPPILTPVKIAESTYLINDANYPEWVKNIYKSQNMIGLVTTSVIKDGTGMIVSKSKTNYDDGSSSPAIGRGNPTSISVWSSSKDTDSNNPNAYITTYAKFDQWGNQYQTTDAKGNSTITTYDPTYHVYPIQVTSAIPDPTGQNGSTTAFITTATFDTVTGLPLTTVDANGLESRIEYDPVSLRPVRAKTFYNNQQIGSETETIYHDEPNNYWVKSRTKIDANKWAESISYFDGLGRAYKAEEIDSEGNIFVEKEFDEDGRVKRVTNPFRANETKIWTTNVYDEASRIKEVILPDGSKVKTDYGVSVSGTVGTTKQITDQAGKKRKGISDALGRMIRVIEDPSGQNLNTDYIFDTLGNLRKTIQGEQSRYFTYDSLGRLLRAKQPEQEVNALLALPSADSITGNNQWSVAYEYDDNGNVTKTTDARNVSVTGIYDNLNRLKTRDYSDATPDVSFYYDGRGLPSIPNFSKGKTTKVSSSVSENRYTSFDVFGRLLTHQQITDGNTYQTGYQYNLSGALIQETYPSGRTVSYNLDQDGDLESVKGQKPNSSAKLYLDRIKYNSDGAMEKMRLGNGRWETAAYNSRGQTTRIGLGYSDTDQSLLKLDYDYGTNLQNNGSLRQQKINYNRLSNQITQNYTYDDLNRLKSAAETVTGNTNPV